MPLIAEKTGLRTFPAFTQHKALYLAVPIAAKIKIMSSNKEYVKKCIQNIHTNAHIAIIKRVIMKTGKNNKEIFPDGL